MISINFYNSKSEAMTRLVRGPPISFLFRAGRDPDFERSDVGDQVLNLVDTKDEPQMLFHARMNIGIKDPISNLVVRPIDGDRRETRRMLFELSVSFDIVANHTGLACDTLAGLNISFGASC